MNYFNLFRLQMRMDSAFVSILVVTASNDIHTYMFYYFLIKSVSFYRPLTNVSSVHQKQQMLIEYSVAR